MYSKTLLLFVLVQSTLLFSQVGVGTTNPTQELDVNGDARVRGLSNVTGTTQPVSALPDGTLVTAGSDPSSLGIRFVGFLTADIAFSFQVFHDIVLGNELIDIFNEHNAATGRYVPSEGGFYEISMDFDLGDYDSTEFDSEVVMGLWNYTTNNWVVRRIHKHINTNIADITPLFNGRSESYSGTNYVAMTAGNSYGFRAFPTYRTPADGVPTTDRISLRFESSGTSGTTLATSFSISRIR